MSERLYSDKLEQKVTKYFEDYGWSILRIKRIHDLLNEAYQEGKASFVTEQTKKVGP